MSVPKVLTDQFNHAEEEKNYEPYLFSRNMLSSCKNINEITVTFILTEIFA